MATNYGAWGAGLSAVGGGGQNARLLAEALGSLRARREHADEMAMREKEMEARSAPVDVSGIPGFEKVQPVDPRAIGLLAGILGQRNDARRTDIAEYKAKQAQLMLSPAEKQTVQDLLVADAQMKNIAEAYQKTPISPAKGSIAAAALDLPLVGGSAVMQEVFPEEAEYRRKLRLAVQSRGKAISGQAMSEKEAERIASTFPPIGSNPRQFNEALANFYLEMQKKAASIPESRHISGYTDVAEQMRGRLPKLEAPLVPERDAALDAKLAKLRAVPPSDPRYQQVQQKIKELEAQGAR